MAELWTNKGGMGFKALYVKVGPRLQNPGGPTFHGPRGGNMGRLLVHMKNYEEPIYNRLF